MTAITLPVNRRFHKARRFLARYYAVLARKGDGPEAQAAWVDAEYALQLQTGWAHGKAYDIYVRFHTDRRTDAGKAEVKAWRRHARATRRGH